MTKKQSTMLQGLAALFLLYHHFFMEPNNLTQYLSFVSVDATRSAAWFCKICVGIFSFVSGYGMYIVARRYDAKGQSFFGRLATLYKNCALRLLKLYGLMWFVIVIFKAIDVFAFQQSIDWMEFLLNMLAVSTTYNGALWYVFEYFWMMLLLPLMDCFFYVSEDAAENKKKWYFYAAAVLIAVVMLILALKLFPALLAIILWIKLMAKPMYLLVFVIGYLVSRFGVYTWFNDCFTNMIASERLNRIIRLAVALILLVVSVAIRVVLATDMNYIKTDFVLVPVFAWAVISILDDNNVISKFFSYILEKCGMISTYLWFIHVFIFSLTYWWLLPLISNPILFYLTELAMTSVASLIIKLIWEGLLLVLCRIKMK